MLVGNDIVDLGDPESQRETLHPRFIARVFSQAEQRAIQSSPDAQTHLWLLWAAKESAFKVLKKMDAELVFTHRQFVVEVEHPRRGHTALGRICHGAHRLTMRASIRPGYVHVLAWLRDRPSDRSGVLFGVQSCPIHLDPSAAVRAVTASAVCKALHMPPKALAIDHGKPPRFVGPMDLTGLDCSLSHHGRWISYAAALPREILAIAPGSPPHHRLALCGRRC